MTRNLPPALILASASPRRRELLATLGTPFTVEVSGVDEESFAACDPGEMVIELAVRKASAVASAQSTGLVIGADTTVVLDGAWLGKPLDPDDAVRLLRLLRGRTHRVLTGVALVDVAGGSIASSVVQSDVIMKSLTDAEIDAYVATGEPMEKAGAYGIQDLGRALVESVTGCFNNVVGLPLCAVAALLGQVDRDIKLPVPSCRREDGGPCPEITGMERAHRG